MRPLAHLAFTGNLVTTTEALRVKRLCPVTVFARLPPVVRLVPKLRFTIKVSEERVYGPAKNLRNALRSIRYPSSATKLARV